MTCLRCYLYISARKEIAHAITYGASSLTSRVPSESDKDKHDMAFNLYRKKISPVRTQSHQDEFPSERKRVCFQNQIEICLRSDGIAFWRAWDVRKKGSLA